MNSYNTLKLKKDNHVLYVSLNRPDVHNAFNDHLISDLTHVFSLDIKDDDIRIIHLSGRGKSFCAGGDLNWMKASLTLSKEDNVKDCAKLTYMLEHINCCSKPVVASVQGAALGGGVGLVSCCDIVVAEKNTVFSFSEVKLGLIPATIGPFVLAKLGESQTRALFLSAERFDAKRAYEIGLVHHVVDSENELASRTDTILKNMLSCSPQALRAGKQFILDLKRKSFEEQQKYAIESLANLRVTPEAQEGLSAFLEKRKPRW